MILGNSINDNLHDNLGEMYFWLLDEKVDWKLFNSLRGNLKNSLYDSFRVSFWGNLEENIQNDFRE